MKIAWFTPFAPPSAIGAYSALVTSELARHCSVDLWVPDRNNSYQTSLGVHDIAELADHPERLNEYTHLLYNMGNHAPFHKAIYQTAMRFPGVMILHDIVMHHFFAGYHSELAQNQNGYRDELTRVYGPDVSNDLWSRLSKGERLWETECVSEYPLFEPCLKNAKGVVTHSRFFRQAAQQKTMVPVTSIPLALAMDLVEAQAAVGRAAPRDPSARLLAVSFGIVGPNKRIHKVIEMLGKNKDLAAKIEYHVLGHSGLDEYSRQLQNLIERYQLQNTVRFLGYQPTPALYDFILSADVCINLRYPPTEGGSASLSDALYFGRPTIVTDVGCYRDVPDDCVIKISPTNEQAELAVALRRLLESPALRTEMGLRAKAHADQNFSAQSYTDALLRFIARVDEFQPRAALLHRVSQELNAMEISPKSYTFRSIAEELAKIWPAETTP